MAMKPIRVVSITSSRLMPSMPEVVVGAERGDPIGALLELKAGKRLSESARPAAGKPGSRPGRQVRPDADQVLVPGRQEEQDGQSGQRSE